MVKKQCCICGKELETTKDNFMYFPQERVSDSGVVKTYPGDAFCPQHGKCYLVFKALMKENMPFDDTNPVYQLFNAKYWEMKGYQVAQEEPTFEHYKVKLLAFLEDAACHFQKEGDAGGEQYFVALIAHARAREPGVEAQVISFLDKWLENSARPDAVILSLWEQFAAEGTVKGVPALEGARDYLLSRNLIDKRGFPVKSRGGDLVTMKQQTLFKPYDKWGKLKKWIERKLDLLEQGPITHALQVVANQMKIIDNHEKFRKTRGLCQAN